MIEIFERVYGLLLLVAGLNGLYFKKGKPPLSDLAAAALLGLEKNLFIFPVAYGSLILGGLLLVLQIAAPFALIIVSPTVLSIYLFNIFLQRNYLSPGLFLCLLNLSFSTIHGQAFLTLFH